MDRRAFCATAAGVLSAGCLNLQEGSGRESATGGATGGGSNGAAGGGSNAEPIETLTLSDAWELEETHQSVAAVDGSFLVDAFDELLRVEVDGTVTWRTPIDDTYTTWPSPELEVHDDTILVATSGDEDAQLYALDGSTGSVRWTDRTASTGTRTEIDHVTVAGDTVVYGSDTGGTDEDQDAVVRSLEASSGDERWADELPETFVVGVESTDDRIYAGTTTGLYVYDSDSGDRIAEHDLSLGFEGIAADGATVYAIDRRDREIVAIEMASGDVRWRNPFDYDSNGGVATDGRSVFVGTNAGYLVAVDARSGDQRWESRLESTVRAPLVVDGNRVWVSDDAGYVTAVAVADGDRPVTERFAEDGVVSVAVVEDVLLTDEGSTAYAVDES